MPTQILQFDDLLECYQYIGTHLSAAVPEPWISTTLTVLLGGDSTAEAATYEPEDSPGDTRAFTVDSPPEFGFAFVDLAELTSDEERGFFQRCVFTLESSGDYNVEFEYDVENIEEEMLALGRPQSY